MLETTVGTLFVTPVTTLPVEPSFVILPLIIILLSTIAVRLA